MKFTSIHILAVVGCVVLISCAPNPAPEVSQKIVHEERFEARMGKLDSMIKNQSGDLECFYVAGRDVDSEIFNELAKVDWDNLAPDWESMFPLLPPEGTIILTHDGQYFLISFFIGPDTPFLVKEELQVNGPKFLRVIGKSEAWVTDCDKSFARFFDSE